MKIAAILDRSGHITSQYEDCILGVFGNGTGTWLCEHRLPLVLPPESGLTETKRAVREQFAQIPDCHVCIVGTLRGLLAVIIQELGCRIWVSEGGLAEQLDNVAQEEARLGAVRAAPVAAPLPVVPIDAATCRIDLAAGMRDNAGFNSRELLIPALEAAPYQRIHVRCDHVPRWFAHELARLRFNLDAVNHDPAGRGVEAILCRLPS